MSAPAVDEVAERIKDLEEEMIRLGKIPITESIDERIKVIENMTVERRKIRTLKRTTGNVPRHIFPFADLGWSLTPVQWTRYVTCEYNDPECAGKMTPPETYTFPSDLFEIAYFN
tara:strand:+ start:297 stop:641 length:345 start_codon:yes stop_codon:yes gene_type:complete